jgi:hypothetical protein
MREILLTQGQVAIVDDADFYWLSQWKWHAQWVPGQRNFIAVRTYEAKSILMHRAILGLDQGDKRQGDHKNGITLDNRRDNLRIAVPSQNTWNQGVRRNNTTGYKGVYFYAKTRRWGAKIGVQRKAIFLGYFSTPELAHEAYCAAAEKYHGEFARTSWEQ